jgi:hypothetical protein
MFAPAHCHGFSMVSLKGSCVRNLASKVSVERVEHEEMGPNGRSLGYLGLYPRRDCGTPMSLSLLSLSLTSCLAMLFLPLTCNPAIHRKVIT